MVYLLYILILVLAAVVPPVLLLLIVNRLDRVEPEPRAMLVKLFFLGMAGMVPILILELLADSLIGGAAGWPLLYLFLAYFCVPGFIEEGVKYKILKRQTWYSREFDYRFDAIVYAVFVSLGFAAVENVLYVMESGLGTAVVRAIFSIPGHAAFGVLMGAGYAAAKVAEVQGAVHRSDVLRRRAYLAAVAAHGLYDFTIMGFGDAVFYPYFAVLMAVAIVTLVRASRRDRAILS